MHIMANAHLILGIVKTRELWALLSEAEEKDSARYQQLSDEYDVSVQDLDGHPALIAFGETCSDESYSRTKVDEEALRQSTQYRVNIRHFLEGLGIDPDPYWPDWYLICYKS